MVCPIVLMKRDRTGGNGLLIHRTGWEWFLRFHWILREWDGNGTIETGRDWF